MHFKQASKAISHNDKTYMYLACQLPVAVARISDYDAP